MKGCTRTILKTPMLKSLWTLFISIILTGLSACASSVPPGSSEVTGALPSPRASAANSTAGITENDRQADCKVLRGRVQVGMLDLKARANDQKSTGLSRAMQSSVSSVLGGPKSGINPSAENARQLARLRALNQLLKERDCKTFDLDKELAATTR